ncbi:MAG: PKD domain-containing protein [Bacteroidota bacterium]|nr:PKD domain-containing protein [Bacteroidota bacterium]
MRGQFLTQVFKLILPKFSYFNTNNFTLKPFFIFAALLIAGIAATAQSYNNIEFIENKGQWDSRVQYKGNVSNGSFFIRSGGFTVLQHEPADFAGLSSFLHGQGPGGRPVRPEDKFVLRSHAWNVDFIGASTSIKTVADKVIPTYNNYFVGNDQSKWGSNCKIYQAITLKDVYPNIDVRYYTDNNFLKYDIIVKPGGDVSKIALRYDGVDKLQVKNKELAISTSVGEMKESSPYTYQSTSTGKNEIGCKYVIKDNVLRFEVKNYDPTSTLVIDPIVIFGSFSGSTADNWGFTATYGPDGSMFGGGIVFDTGFPVSTGAFQTTYGAGGGNFDMGIIKLSPNGTTRIYATYIGGGGDDQPHSLIVDNLGNLVIAGRTNSGNYPVINPGGQVGVGGGFDIVVTKLNAAGTALIGSKKIGGSSNDGVNISESRSLNSLQRNYGDDGRSEVILDGGGNVYVAACTQSSNFPVSGSPFQSSFGGGMQDGVLIKLTPSLNAVSFASYLGGSANDAAYVLSLAPNGSIYVAGGTESGNLPGSTAGTVGTANHGNIDGFVSVISNNGTSVIRTTYIGTTAIDQVFGVQFDQLGFPYVMGQTTGNWPIFNATFSNAGGKQFIAKLQPDLSAFVYSTAFGTGSSTPNISPIAFLVDRCENVYISGWGGFFGTQNGYGSSGTNGLSVTADAIKSTTDGKDLYFFVLKKDATQQLFGSFYGENNATNGGCDHVDGGTSRFDANGVIYQAICGNCKLNAPPINPIPGLVTSGSWSTTNNSPNCNLTMVKISMNLAGVAGGVQSAIDGTRDTAGCLPLPVIFTDSIGNAQTYEWHFNYVPGNPPNQITTAPTASFTYTAVGVYRVLLVAVDLNTCNQRDSSFINIRVGDLRADLRPAWQPVGPGCPKFTYQFINNSVTDISRPFQDTSFLWDFGDGSPRVPAKIGAINAVTHTYPALGTYLPKLILKDTAYCNNPDDSTFTISIADIVKAIISTPASGCLQYNAVFKSNSLNGVTFAWDFGDPSSPNNTSNLENPTHLYTAVGTYIVRLTATNPGTCNIFHDTTFTVSVFDSPIPDFSFAPVPAQENTATTFTNLSSPDAVRFKWDFGDGDTLLTTSRAPLQHQYNATGTFIACLTAYNFIGCDSVICKPVQALIVPVVDVPNAFTPQSGDVNSVILVRGFGIAKMQFIIWNRWGQKVFETNNRFQGWDGRVKGAVQPMDVYVYTLNIEFSDGTKTTKKGDITLIR